MFCVLFSRVIFFDQITQLALKALKKSMLNLNKIMAKTTKEGAKKSRCEITKAPILI